ncbi:MAG: GWxTD domain-containing protein [Calditrichaceae bacterium]
MRKFQFLLIISIITGMLLTNVYGQYYEKSKYSGVGIPFFEAGVQKQYKQDLSGYTLSIMAEILYDDLTFVKSDTSGYDADLEWLVAVYDSDGKVIFSRTINKKFNVENYEATNNRNLNLVIKDEIDFKPGDYQLLMKTTDLITNKSAQRKNELNLPDYTSEKLAMSSISFMKSVNMDSAKHVVDFIPTFGDNFTIRSGSFYIYFDLYSSKTDVPFEIHYFMKDEKNIPGVDTVVTGNIEKQVTSHFIRLDRSSLLRNRYNLEVTVKVNKEEVKETQPLSFYWSDVPSTVDDIDLALKQMTYIMSQDSIKAYKNKSLSEKQMAFKQFWDERDPNKSTAKNELMNEYFRRVNYSVENFSRSFSKDGWQTDRGRILIKFGFPDDIERHPFEMGSLPFEVWRYYSLRKTFLFHDRTGFGDYYLHPDYLDVEFQ